MAITRATKFKQLLAEATSKKELVFTDMVFNRRFVLAYNNPNNYKFCVARVPGVGICYGYHNTLGFTLLTPTARRVHTDTSKIQFIAGVVQIKNLDTGLVMDTDFRPNE